MIPAHVADATTQNGISRRAKERTCETCGAAIIVGLDADRAAGEARADIAPVTPLGEAMALLAGRTTYLLRTAGRLELDHRSHWHIRGAGADQAVVLAEHRCHAPQLPAKDAAITPTIKELPDDPDF